MIDPYNVTHYDQTHSQLEENLLFWVFAAGKTAKTAASALDSLLSKANSSKRKKSPFKILQNYDGNLPALIKECGMGCYNQKSRTISEILRSNLDLQTCSLSDLEKIYGIGMKTSRCFLIHSRRDMNVAGIDTHILKYLGTKGIEVPVSRKFSSKKQYLFFEKEFLKLVPKGMSVAEFDLKIWNSYAS